MSMRDKGEFPKKPRVQIHTKPLCERCQKQKGSKATLWKSTAK